MGCAPAKPTGCSSTLQRRGTVTTEACDPSPPPFGSTTPQRRTSATVDDKGEPAQRRRSIPSCLSPVVPSPPSSDPVANANASEPCGGPTHHFEGDDYYVEDSENNATYGSLTDCHTSPFGAAHDTGEGGTTPPECSLAVLRFRKDDDICASSQGCTDTRPREPQSPNTPPPPREGEPKPWIQPETAEPRRPLPPISPSVNRSRQFLLERYTRCGPTTSPAPAPAGVTGRTSMLHSIAGDTDRNLDQTRDPVNDPSSGDERQKAFSSPNRPPSVGGYLSIEPEPLWWKTRYGQQQRQSTVERFKLYRDRTAAESGELESPGVALPMVSEWLQAVVPPERSIEEEIEEYDPIEAVESGSNLGAVTPPIIMEEGESVASIIHNRLPPVTR